MLTKPSGFAPMDGGVAPDRTCERSDLGSLWLVSRMTALLFWSAENARSPRETERAVTASGEA